MLNFSVNMQISGRYFFDLQSPQSHPSFLFKTKKQAKQSISQSQEKTTYRLPSCPNQKPNTFLTSSSQLSSYLPSHLSVYIFNKQASWDVTPSLSHRARVQNPLYLVTQYVKWVLLFQYVYLLYHIPDTYYLTEQNLRKYMFSNLVFCAINISEDSLYLNYKAQKMRWIQVNASAATHSKWCDNGEGSIFRLG